MNIVIDSSISLEKALNGTTAPEEIINTLRLIDIDYISFDDNLHRGQLLVHESVAGELLDMFKQLLEWRFPIAKMIPISEYNWSDEASMEDNNSSGFCYRFVYGTNEPSNHSYGLAIDINPVQNPYISVDGTIFPINAIYDPEKPGTLKKNDEIVSLFESKGWKWDGYGMKIDGKEITDWQHFQKVK